MRIKHDLQVRVGCYRIWPEYYLSKEGASILSFYVHGTGPSQNTQTEGTEKSSESEPQHSVSWWTLKSQNVWELSSRYLYVRTVSIFCLSTPAKECQGNLYILIWVYIKAFLSYWVPPNLRHLSPFFPQGLDSCFLLSMFFFFGEQSASCYSLKCSSTRM